MTLALCRFPDDDYTEVAAKVTGSLDRVGLLLGCRLDGADHLGDHPGPQVAGSWVFPGLFERTCGPVAGKAGLTAAVAALGTAQGAFLSASAS